MSWHRLLVTTPIDRLRWGTICLPPVLSTSTWNGLARSAAGRQLESIGLADDVADAACEDRYPVLPVFHDRRLQLVAG